MDVFRIFDAFNDLEQMDLCVRTVLERTNKLAEACICFTGNFLDPNEKVYTLEYYTGLARRMVTKWPDLHLICIKDMAGLLTPQLADTLIRAIIKATDNCVPIHVHTHDTAGGQIATLLSCIRAGAKVVDAASASVSGLTS